MRCGNEALQALGTECVTIADDTVMQNALGDGAWVVACGRVMEGERPYRLPQETVEKSTGWRRGRISVGSNASQGISAFCRTWWNGAGMRNADGE